MTTDTERTPKTRFDNWNDVVDCNDCAKYWDDSCDGVSKGSKRLCNSFLATRSVVIPLKLKSQQNAIKWLIIWNAILTGVVLGLIGVMIL